MSANPAGSYRRGGNERAQSRAAPVVAAMIVGLAAASPAEAHQSSLSYSHMKLGRGAPEYELKISSRDLYEALALDRDRDAEDDEILGGRDKLGDYVTKRIRFTSDRGACAMEPRDVRIVRQQDRFAALRFAIRCPDGSRELTLAYELFFDLDPRHASRVTLTRGERTITQPDLTRPTTDDPRANLRSWAWDFAGGDATKGHLAWIVEGLKHIYTGYDHVAFLVGLLLVAAVRRRKALDAGWEPRGLRAGVFYVLQVVTAFTVAHSITLIAAALGVFSLPQRLVESAIAASIVFVAVENVILGDPRGRWIVAFVFGLIHGFGFAGTLAPQLPPTGVVVPLLELNIGVELGQLSIVLVVYPILHAVAQANPHPYRRWVVVVGSSIVGLFGLLWLIERIFELDLITGVLFGG